MGRLSVRRQETRTGSREELCSPCGNADETREKSRLKGSKIDNILYISNLQIENRVLMASQQVLMASRRVGVASQCVRVASQRVLIGYEVTP